MTRAKPTLQKDHIPASLAIARKCLERLELSEADRETVLFLIEHHLDMGANLRRDIFDPRTVAQFAESMGSPDRLKMLCLFTYADIKAVNPEALTPWKAEDLWQLYIGTANYLNRSVDERVHARRERRSPESSSLAGRGRRARSCRHFSTACRGAICARIRWTKFCGTSKWRAAWARIRCNSR